MNVCILAILRDLNCDIIFPKWFKQSTLEVNLGFT